MSPGASIPSPASSGPPGEGGQHEAATPSRDALESWCPNPWWRHTSPMRPPPGSAVRQQQQQAEQIEEEQRLSGEALTAATSRPQGMRRLRISDVSGAGGGGLDVRKDDGKEAHEEGARQSSTLPSPLNGLINIVKRGHTHNMLRSVPKDVLGRLRVRMGIATGVLEPGGGISNSEVLARAKGEWAGRQHGRGHHDSCWHVCAMTHADIGSLFSLAPTLSVSL